MCGMRDEHMDPETCAGLFCAVVSQAVADARAGKGGRALAHYLFAPSGGLAVHAPLTGDMELSAAATRAQLRSEGVTPVWLIRREAAMERVRAREKAAACCQAAAGVCVVSEVPRAAEGA